MAIHRRPQALRYRALTLAFSLLALAGCASEKPDNAHVCALYAGGASDAEVIAQGTVVAMLGTTNGPSGNHEGFLLKLSQQCDLLLRVETNVDITGPVPLRAGETVTVKGQFEDDPTGGVIHWTHHDPSGHHVAGYVLVDGKYYE
ncbi:MAG TPA: DUF3465 domain-containing protein [Alphaproteobacteria bacterium]|nr:DUF3465 domain-containing protein [Alphaproteobacteria bacterium]